MKRRVLIAKALAHEPEILFLDEPTAGVDVELRRDMWEMVRQLREKGVTIILTTHYIEEAEDMADRIGVIDKGEMIVVEEKHALCGGSARPESPLASSKSSTPCRRKPVRQAAVAVGRWHVALLHPEAATATSDSGLADLLKNLTARKIDFRTVNTDRSSLEDIFIDLVGKSR